MSDRVTVLITCYNEKAFISEAIASVVAQSAYDRIERILVIDDGSSDGSIELLQDLQRQIPKLEVHRTNQLGPSTARNLGLAETQTEWVAFLDGDDVWTEHKLRTQLECADVLGRDVAILYTDFVDFTDGGSEIGLKVRRFSADHDPLVRYFIFDAPMVTSTVLLRTAVARKAGYFDAALSLFEDNDFFLRIAEAGGRFHYVPGMLVRKRRRRGSLSSHIHGWERANLEVTRRCLARRPDLRQYEQRRLSYRLGKVAEAMFASGEDDKGWTLLRRALRLNPLNVRAQFYVVLGLIPVQFRSRAKRVLQRARTWASSVALRAT